MLVIVTHELDAHADAVIAALRRKGFADFMRIDLDTAGSRLDLSLEPARRQFRLRSRDVPDRCCTQDNLSTIWWRRSGRIGDSSRTLAPTPDTLDDNETYHAVKWLLESMPESCFPLGHPNAMRPAENKIQQLHLAHELGFAIPDTLFTNDRDSLVRFADAHGELVVKPLKTSYVYDPETTHSVSLYARCCSARQVLDLTMGEPGFALYAQDRIAKVADIRVNVFPSQAVACRIDAARLGPDEVDWRPTTFDHDHDIIAMPPGLEARCRAFLACLGLKWGAFDFGLTADGEWVFFECNPNGQWMWIESKTGFSLSGLIAQTMIEHHAARHEPESMARSHQDLEMA